jgi:hypothetical protein
MASKVNVRHAMTFQPRLRLIEYFSAGSETSTAEGVILSVEQHLMGLLWVGAENEGAAITEFELGTNSFEISLIFERFASIKIIQYHDWSHTLTLQYQNCEKAGPNREGQP